MSASHYLRHLGVDDHRRLFSFLSLRLRWILHYDCVCVCLCVWVLEIECIYVCVCVCWRESVCVIGYYVVSREERERE